MVSGLMVSGIWIAQNNDELKEEFIYYIFWFSNQRFCSWLPQDHTTRVSVWYPFKHWCRCDGLLFKILRSMQAFETLMTQGQPLRGVMTWSINWDMGTDKNGQQYNEQFIQRLRPICSWASDTATTSWRWASAERRWKCVFFMAAHLTQWKA